MIPSRLTAVVVMRKNDMPGLDYIIIVLVVVVVASSDQGHHFPNSSGGERK